MELDDEEDEDESLLLSLSLDESLEESLILPMVGNCKLDVIPLKEALIFENKKWNRKFWVIEDWNSQQS